jgi:hypothetical protein
VKPIDGSIPCRFFCHYRLPYRDSNSSLWFFAVPASVVTRLVAIWRGIFLEIFLSINNNNSRPFVFRRQRRRLFNTVNKKLGEHLIHRLPSPFYFRTHEFLIPATGLSSPGVTVIIPSIDPSTVQFSLLSLAPISVGCWLKKERNETI